MPREASGDGDSLGRRAVAVGLFGAGVGLVSGALLSRARRSSSSVEPSAPAGRLSGVQVDGLPRRRLAAALPGAIVALAPCDAAPSYGNGGIVAHPRRPLIVFDLPGGQAFARVEPTLLGGQAWLPIIGKKPGWVQLLLPARSSGPAAPTGWADAERVTLALSRHEIRVLVGSGRAKLVFAGRITKTWPASCGTPETPTLVGRTFVLAVARDARRQPDPLVLPLSVPSIHAGCGASGVIAIHTGPPHPGCITVPPAALPVLARTRRGSLVRIFP